MNSQFFSPINTNFPYYNTTDQGSTEFNVPNSPYTDTANYILSMIDVNNQYQNRQEHLKLQQDRHPYQSYGYQKQFGQLNDINTYHQENNSSNCINQQSVLIPRNVVECTYPLFGLDWNKNTVLVSTFKEDVHNKVHVIKHHNDDEFELVGLLNDLQYPASKVLGDPLNCNRFLTCSQTLQLFEYNESCGDVIEIGNFSNFKNSLHFLPPITSMDWNTVDPSRVLSSSVDTTCSLWDINTGNVVTRLIAHDSPVYDVKFLHGSTNDFVSVGEDGSMRYFDLRSLEHSTIVFEPPPQVLMPNGKSKAYTTTPLLRVDTCKVNKWMVACVPQRSPVTLIFDLRKMAKPVLALEGHEHSTGYINNIAWHPNKEMVLTCSDDCQALVWDFSVTQRNENSVYDSVKKKEININGGLSTLVYELPNFQFQDVNYRHEMNNCTWNPTGDHFGVISGKRFTSVKFLG